MSGRSLAVVIATLGLVAVLPACERGCAARERITEARWGAAPGAGGVGPSGSSSAGLDLGGTDCSDGLARCVAGAVEVSRLAHLPSRCVPAGASPERAAPSCSCPWDPAGGCRHGCAIEGIVIAASPLAARVQLCKPGPDELASRPALAEELRRVEVCAEEGVRCRDGIVQRCERAGAPSHVLGACAFGCASEVDGLEAGESLPTDGLVAILCRRQTAERR